MEVAGFREFLTGSQQKVLKGYDLFPHIRVLVMSFSHFLKFFKPLGASPQTPTEKQKTRIQKFRTQGNESEQRNPMT